MAEQLQLDFFSIAYDFWDEAQNAARSSLVLAAKAGQALLQAKAQLPHGQFEKKLEQDGRIGIRKAQQCMQVAKGYPDLLYGKAQTFALLDFSQAVMLLSADEETKAIVQEKLDAGDSVTVREIEELKRLAAEKDSEIDRLKRDKSDAVEKLISERDREKQKRRQAEAVTKASDREKELARQKAEAEEKAERLASELASAKAQIEGGLGVAELLEPKVVIQEDTESKRELERVRQQLEEKTRLHELAAKHAGQFQEEMHKATSRAAFLENKLKEVEDTSVVLGVFARQVQDWKAQVGFVATVIKDKEQTLDAATIETCREIAERLMCLADFSQDHGSLESGE